MLFHDREKRKKQYLYKTPQILDNHSIKPALLIFFTIITLFGVYILRQNNQQKHPTNSSFMKPFTIKNTKGVSTEKDVTTFSKLSLQIHKKLKNEEGVYSIRFEDLNTNFSFGINDTNVVTAASVIKIPLLAAVYSLAESNKLDLNQKIIITESDMQRWGTGIIRYEEPGVTYTIQELTELLIKKSDNTAAYVLSHKVVGLNRLEKLIQSWGLTNTSYTENETTNQDMNLLLKKMYQGDIVKTQILKKEMLNTMTNSDFEERLPKYIPKTIPVYHKIGNEVRVTNDVGIIDLPEKPYYLGILASEVPNHEHAKEVIAEISKMVFDFQNSRSS